MNTDNNTTQMYISQLIAHSTFSDLSNTPTMLPFAVLFAVFMTANCEDVADVLTRMELKMTEMSETISKLEASLYKMFFVQYIYIIMYI